MEGTAVGSAVAEEDYRDVVVLQNHLACQGSTRCQVVASADNAIGAKHAD